MEKSHKGVIDLLPGLVWTTSAGNTDFINQRLRSYVGLGDGAAEDWLAAMHPDDLAAFDDSIAGASISGQETVCVGRLHHFEKGYRWFQFRTNSMRDAAGSVIGHCGIGTDIDELKLVEQDLRLRHSYYMSVADSIPYSLAVMTPAGEVEYINKHLSDFTGLGLNEIRNWETSIIVHPEDLFNVQASWQRAVENRSQHDVELRIRRADGVYRWFQNRALPLFDDNGNVARWYSMHIEIDDRRQAESLLAAEKRLLEMAAGGNALPDILDAICQTVESMAKGCRCSVVLADPSGLRVGQGAAPGLPDSFMDSIVGSPIDGGAGPCSMAMKLKRSVVASDLASDSHWRSSKWGQSMMSYGIRACWSAPIVSGQGEVLGAFGIYYDHPIAPPQQHRDIVQQFDHIASLVIERAQNDALRRQSETFLTEGQRLSQTGSFLWRLDTDEITASAELYRIFEFEPDTPITLDRIMRRVHPDDLSLLGEKIETARQLGSGLAYEIRLLMPSGILKFLQTVAHYSGTHDGRREILGVLQDVSHRRASEEALNQVRSELARMARATSLGALTASIAHEVNQPLSGIVTNASTCLKMLEADPPNVRGAQETARRTVRDAKRAADIISRLRALFAKQDTTINAVDLNAAAREIIALSKSDLQKSRVTIRLSLAEDLPLVAGDRIQLQQVILNLVLNAADAVHDVHDRERVVSIQTDIEPPDHVRLSVRDNGVGLDPVLLERLFEAFYTTKTKGMGIGLSVSHTIVENHGGRLWIEDNDEHGATFVFTVPRSRHAVPVLKEAAKQRPNDQPSASLNVRKG